MEFTRANMPDLYPKLTVASSPDPGCMRQRESV